jgi:hypothetical protein
VTPISLRVTGKKVVREMGGSRGSRPLVCAPVPRALWDLEYIIEKAWMTWTPSLKSVQAGHGRASVEGTLTTCVR